jgi:hypothetical protein
MQTTVKHLLPGDVLLGSGFTVTSAPFVAVNIPRGKMCIQGHYPSKPESIHVWGASTTVTIKREGAVPEPA